MDHSNAQEIMWLIRHNQKQGFVAGMLFSVGAYTLVKTAKHYKISVRKKPAVAPTK